MVCCSKNGLETRTVSPSRTAQGIMREGGEMSTPEPRSQELASKRGKNLSALIREQLEALTQEKSELEEVTEEILAIMQEHSGKLTKWRREEFYDV